MGYKSSKDSLRSDRWHYKMVEEDRYCVDVSNQILSVQALLKKTNLKIIDQHIKHCVKQAFSEGEVAGNKKVDEIIKLLDKYAK